jgi:hypothetical protein
MHERAPRKRDRDRGAEEDALAVLGDERQRQVRVVAGFRRPDRVESDLLGGLR